MYSSGSGRHDFERDDFRRLDQLPSGHAETSQIA